MSDLQGGGFQALSELWGNIQKDVQVNGDQFAAAADNATEEIKLDNDALYRGMDLQLNFAYTAGTGGTLRIDNPFTLVKELRWVANGDVLQRASGYELYLMAQIARGQGNPVDMTRAPATTTSTTGKAMIPIDATFLGVQPPHAGCVPAMHLPDGAFKLQIDWATSLTDAFGYGMGGSPAVTASLVVFKRLVLEPVPAAQGYGSRILTVLGQSVSTTDPSKKYNLEPGLKYGTILFVNKTGTNNDLSDAAGLTTGNTTIYLDTSSKRSQMTDTLMRQLVRSRFPTNYPGTTTRVDLTGIYAMDCANKYAADNDAFPALGQFLNAGGAKTVQIEAPVTAGTNTNLRILAERWRAVLQSAMAMKLPVR